MIKTREEILKEILKKGKETPTGWRATYRYDHRLHATEYNLLNPEVGIYQIKEWQKNPFDVRGVGSKIARRIDEDLIDQPRGDFGIIKYNPRRILEDITRGVTLNQLLEDVLYGKKRGGMEMALTGKIHTATNTIPKRYREKQAEIDKEIEKIQEDEGLYDSYV